MPTRSIIFILIWITSAQAQNLDPARTTTWNRAGLTMVVVPSENQVDITDFGADPTGNSPSNAAYNAARISFGGAAGTIYFPEGIYLFNSTIAITDSIFLKGDGISSVLRFNLGGSGQAMQMVGAISPTDLALAETAIKGSYMITLEDASTVESNDVIRLFQFDEDLLASSWAYGTVGQVVRVVSKEGNVLTLEDPLNMNYPLSREPFIKRIDPVEYAGMECLKLERLDATSAQTDHVYITHAFNCAFRNLEMVNSNFGMLDINSSAHLLVEGCYQHHAFAYGGGGQGYGTVLQSASSFCLVQNNTFEHLRHSMLLQSGANGNVLAYNYSRDPYWNEGAFYPTNSAGEIVLHGNYPYLNLFEGNTVQNIVVDASHESNGPYNTFLRNRGELYGFFSDPNTPTDSMNLIGNEITSTGFPYGLFNVNGNGHYSYGNNVYGTTTPTGTASVSLNTLFLDGNPLPEYLSEVQLPLIGYPLSLGQLDIPAEERYTNAPVSCSNEVVTKSESIGNQKAIVLMGSELRIEPSLLPAQLEIYSLTGQLTDRMTILSSQFDTRANCRQHFNLIRVTTSDGSSVVIKYVKADH